tara:strand:+ start:738 stop:1244 length:507 start_codon:yes stop_codon:yes gene_type:complete
MIDYKMVMGGVLATFGAEAIGKGVRYLYEESGLKDSFLGSTIDSFSQNERVRQAVSGVAEEAIRQKLVPDYGATPQMGGISLDKGKVRTIGTTQDFDPFSQGDNLLYTGKTGRIADAMQKTGVKQFVIGEIASGDVVRPTLGQKRTIANPAIPLKLGALKRGQIESAR